MEQIKLRSHRATFRETGMYYHVEFTDGYYAGKKVRIGKNGTQVNKKRLVREAIRRLQAR